MRMSASTEHGGADDGAARRLPAGRKAELAAYVAEMGEEFTTKYDRKDRRLRVIYDNGTENDVLQRSLQRALHRDATARFIVEVGRFAHQRLARVGRRGGRRRHRTGFLAAGLRHLL